MKTGPGTGAGRKRELTSKSTGPGTWKIVNKSSRRLAGVSTRSGMVVISKDVKIGEKRIKTGKIIIHKVRIKFRKVNESGFHMVDWLQK